MASNIVLLQRKSANDPHFHAIAYLLPNPSHSSARIYRAQPATLRSRIVKYVQRAFDKAFMV